MYVICYYPNIFVTVVTKFEGILCKTFPKHQPQVLSVEFSDISKGLLGCQVLRYFYLYRKKDFFPSCD